MRRYDALGLRGEEEIGLDEDTLRGRDEPLYPAERSYRAGDGAEDLFVIIAAAYRDRDL